MASESTKNNSSIQIMKNITHCLVLVAVFIFSTNTGFAQEGQSIEVRDFETWTSGQVKLNIYDEWSVGLEGQMRLDENSTELKNFFTELSTRVKFSKHIDIGLAFRYTNRNDNEGLVQGNEHFARFHIDGSYKHKIKRFDFEYRLRNSNSNEIGISKVEGDTPVRYWRLKTAVGYNIRKWKLDPEFSAEIFNKRIKYGISNGFDQYRLTIGTSYKTKNFGKIGVAYRLQQEISSSYPSTQYIVQLKYAYTFKK